jgi:hypothetical protein
MKSGGGKCNQPGIKNIPWCNLFFEYRFISEEKQSIIPVE